MEMKLELVVVPVSDIDHSKEFYVSKLGFDVVVDDTIGTFRNVQLSPPGSGCAIAIDSGYFKMEPGSVKGLQLVVLDIEAVRSKFVDNNVDVSSIQHYEGTELVEGRGGRWNSFIFFSDPDGNEWIVQERPSEK